MTTVYKAYEQDDGIVTYVREGSEADLIFSENEASTPNPPVVPALENTVSEDGMENVTPAFMPRPTANLVGGRYYLYSADRWITDADDNYGVYHLNHAELAGSGDEPTYEWEHMGDYFRAGTQIKSFSLVGRANATDVKDLEIRLVAKYPTDPEAWKTGFNADTQVSVQTIYSGLYSEMGVTADDLARFTRGFVELDVELAQDSMICMYMRKTDDGVSTRYFTGSRTMEVL